MKQRFVLFITLICCGITFAGEPSTIPVVTRKNSNDSVWVTYQAQTVENLPGYTPAEEPLLSRYGGYLTEKRTATGFFRTEKIDNRWWIIDPEGYPFHHRAVVAFTPGDSDRQQEAFRKKFGTDPVWAEEETAMLRSYGFNGAGAWSATEVMHAQENPLVYTIIVNPMNSYRNQHRKEFGGTYDVAGWQGYRFDLPLVFDVGFEEHIRKTIAPLAAYKDDPYLLGYFTDNELPWWNDALDRHLTLLDKQEKGYIAAKKWLDNRKGEAAGPEAITEEDRMEFTAYFFETYMQKVTSVLRETDPNHLYLGCRFNQDKDQELTNPRIFEVAGRYMDIISINHYHKWQPLQQQMDQWGEWSGKPFLITEWYIKGEDSGLTNETGAGWNVPTQQERGLFYENFTLELLKNPWSVGWHWFRYQDNDPDNLRTDPSNRDSNKGVVDSDYTPWKPLLEHAVKVNKQVYPLIRFFDRPE